MGKKFTVDAQAIIAAQACQATNDVRYFLNGVFFGENGDIAGTNGHVLAVTETGMPLFGQDTIIKVIGRIPAKSGDAEIDVEALTITTSKGRIFKFEIIEGKYPNYRAVIPAKVRRKVSSSVEVNPNYIALAGKVFGGQKGWPWVRFSIGDYMSPIYFHNKNTKLVIMPMRHADGEPETFLITPKKQTRKAA